MPKERKKRSAPAIDAVSSRDKLWFAGLAILSSIALLLGYLLIEAFMPVFLAFALAYAFSPVADNLERRGLSRPMAVSALMLALALVFAVLLAFILPTLIREAREFAASLPHDLMIASSRLSEFGNRFGFSLPVGQELVEALKKQLESLAFGEGAPGMALLRRLFSSLGNAAAWSLNLLIVPVFFFFFLRDLPAIKRKSLGLVPLRLQAMAWAVAEEINRVFSGYIRGQLTVALVLGLIFASALSILQVRFGLVIGLLAGFLNIIPYVGQITGLILSLLMVLVEGSQLGRLAVIPVVFGVVNFIEGTFITPQIVGNKVGLSAPQTMLALILGAELAGLMGMIIAIPLAGSFKVLLIDVFENYKRSHLFTAGKS